MIQDKAKNLILILCFALAPSLDRVALAQPARPNLEPLSRQCYNWTPPPWDKPGVRRLLFPTTVTATIRGTYRRAGASVTGVFVSSADVVIGLISEPGRTEPSSQFVTRAGTTIDFFADGSDRPQPVRNGRLDDGGRRLATAATDSIDCVKGASTAALEPARVETYLDDPARRPGSPEAAPRLTDVFTGRETSTGEKAGSRPADETKLEDVFRDKSKLPPAEPARPADKAGASAAAAPKLSDVFGATAASPTGGSPSAKNKTFATGVNPLPPDAAPTPRSPEAADPKDGVSSLLVCDVRNRSPVPVANGTVIASLQTVGLRNDRAEARSFEYFGKGGDARPLDRSLDIAESARQLVSYEPLADRRRPGSEPLLVSVAGVDAGRVRQDKPAKTLRIIVVAGAAELSISGLDLVGSELRKPGGDPVKLDIEWYAIEQTGAIKQAGHYSSLELLVKDAAAKNRERPDVLNETQLLTLFGAFENLLKSQTQPFEKAIWIKGAYPIPSSIPQRFEKLIERVSNVVASHRAGGQPGKWLVLITSRMPGFSIAYLKQPIYSLQIGDVIEESGEHAAGLRRLIDDPVLLATRLRLAGVVPKGRGDPSPKNVAPAGRLALDAKDIFVERGYVLSPEMARALQLHLQRVPGLWDSAGLRPDVLADLETLTGKSQPSLLDILQAPDPKKYPQLPSNLPDWFHKPIRDLSTGEGKLARNAVAGYAEGAGRLAAIAKVSAANPRPGCPLFYVTEAYFGFDRLEKSPAAASKTKLRVAH